MRVTQPKIRFATVRSQVCSTVLELQLPRCSPALSGSDLGLYHCGGSITFYVPLSGPKSFFFFPLKVSGGTLGIKILNFEFAPRLSWVSCLGGAQ